MDIHCSNTWGNTAAMCAASDGSSDGHARVLELLVAHGARVDDSLENREGESARRLVSMCGSQRSRSIIEISADAQNKLRGIDEEEEGEEEGEEEEEKEKEERESESERVNRSITLAQAAMESVAKRKLSLTNTLQ